jgi:hypothetical protein
VVMRLFSKLGVVVVTALILTVPAQAGPTNRSLSAIDLALSYESLQGIQQIESSSGTSYGRRCVRWCRASSPESHWRFHRCVAKCVHWLQAHS